MKVLNAPCEAFGEWALKEAIEGCLDGIRTLALEPRLSPVCKSLFSLNSETFINRVLGVLKMVRFSRQRALQLNIVLNENRFEIFATAFPLVVNS